jgi:nucleoid-associated protein YgaU
MKKFTIFLISILFLSGCATLQVKKEEKKSKEAEKKEEKEETLEEIINIKLNQTIAIAETSLEVSKNAEKIAIEALNLSKQVNADLDATIKKLNEAIEALNQIRKFVEDEVKKAIDKANEAIRISNEASRRAMEYADKKTEEAIEIVAAAIEQTEEVMKETLKMAQEASELAIRVAKEGNEQVIKLAKESSEHSIAIANQTLAEINRVRAILQIKEEEPIIEKEPLEAKYYIVKKGDTLKKIAYKFYNDTSKWEVIYKANKHIIKNPDALTPGIKILIP